MYFWRHKLILFSTNFYETNIKVTSFIANLAIINNVTFWTKRALLSSPFFCIRCFLRLFEDVFIHCSRNTFSGRFYPFCLHYWLWKDTIQHRVLFQINPRRKLYNQIAITIKFWCHKVVIICSYQIMWLALNKISHKIVFLF